MDFPHCQNASLEDSAFIWKSVICIENFLQIFYESIKRIRETETNTIAHTNLIAHAADAINIRKYARASKYGLRLSTTRKNDGEARRSSKQRVQSL